MLLILCLPFTLGFYSKKIYQAIRKSKSNIVFYQSYSYINKAIIYYLSNYDCNISTFYDIQQQLEMAVKKSCVNDNDNHGKILASQFGELYVFHM